MAFAQVKNGVVSAIQEGVGDETWLPCGGAVAVGWTYINGVFSPPIVAPVPLTLPQLAELALSRTDTTIVRCYSAGITVPTAWQTYRNALRAILNGTDTTSTTLPTAPAYPVGS